LSPAAGVYASTYRGAVSVVSVSLGTLDPRCTPLARDRSPAGSFRSVEHIATQFRLLSDLVPCSSHWIFVVLKSRSRADARVELDRSGKKKFCFGGLVASDPGSKKGKRTVGGASGRRWGERRGGGVGGSPLAQMGCCPSRAGARRRPPDSGDRACEWQSRGMRGAGAAGSSWGVCVGRAPSASQNPLPPRQGCLLVCRA
jgi:hypothetical protein